MQARLYTRILLEGMAKRLDRVNPQGSPRSGFAKRVARLYETETQKRERRERRALHKQQQQQQSSPNRHTALHLIHEDIPKILAPNPETPPPVGGGAEGVVCLYDPKLHQRTRRSKQFGGEETDEELDEVLGEDEEKNLHNDEDDDDEDEDDEEDILQTLRSPETVKTFAMLEERLRQYKKSRELGGANVAASSAAGGVGATGGGGGEGGSGPPVSTWISRVSSRLVTDPVQLTIPSTLREDQRAAGLEWQQLHSRMSHAQTPRGHRMGTSPSPAGGSRARLASLSPRR